MDASTAAIIGTVVGGLIGRAAVRGRYEPIWPICSPTVHLALLSSSRE
jgi:hypothetical protein